MRSLLAFWMGGASAPAAAPAPAVTGYIAWRVGTSNMLILAASAT